VRAVFSVILWHLGSPFDPFDPFNPYSQVVDASPGGCCRCGQAQDSGINNRGTD
jgi:hypothetical protein